MGMMTLELCDMCVIRVKCFLQGNHVRFTLGEITLELCDMGLIAVKYLYWMTTE